MPLPLNQLSCECECASLPVPEPCQFWPTRALNSGFNLFQTKSDTTGKSKCSIISFPPLFAPPVPLPLCPCPGPVERLFLHGLVFTRSRFSFLDRPSTTVGPVITLTARFHSFNLYTCPFSLRVCAVVTRLTRRLCFLSFSHSPACQRPFLFIPCSIELRSPGRPTPKLPYLILQNSRSIELLPERSLKVSNSACRPICIRTCIAVTAVQCKTRRRWPVM